MMRVTYILVMKPGIFPRRVPVVYAEYSNKNNKNFLVAFRVMVLSRNNKNFLVAFRFMVLSKNYSYL